MNQEQECDCKICGNDIKACADRTCPCHNFGIDKRNQEQEIEGGIKELVEKISTWAMSRDPFVWSTYYPIIDSSKSLDPREAEKVLSDFISHAISQAVEAERQRIKEWANSLWSDDDYWDETISIDKLLDFLKGK
jgi:hypothetical protein